MSIPTILTVSGCARCPFVALNPDEQAVEKDPAVKWTCTRREAVFIPRSAAGHGSPADAIPHKCPLWDAGVMVQLDRKGPTAYEGKD